MSENSAPATLWRMATEYFMTARLLQVAAELDIFGSLAAGPRNAAALAVSCHSSEHGLEALLVGLAALGLLERSSSGQYRLTRLAHDCLVPGQPDFVGDLVAGAGSVYADWLGLREAVEAGRGIARRGPRSSAATRGYHEAVYRSSQTQAAELAASLDLSPFRRLVDVGGGLGAYSIACCRANPRLVALVLDLPEVVAIARQKVAKVGLGDRISVRAGDYRQAGFGIGAGLSPDAEYDLALLANVLHQEKPEVCQAIVERAHQALATDGVLVAHDLFLNPQRTGPLPAALGGLNMLVHGEGRAYGIDDVTAWYRAAGFTEPSVHWQSLGGLAVVAARKR